jgi:6-phosphofructokinase 2
MGTKEGRSMLPHIVTLTLNPALDLSADTDEIVPSHKLRCVEPRRDPGGGGINVARVLRRLGREVRAVFPIGGLIGAHLAELVRAEAVDVVAVPVESETREDVTITERLSGRQYRFVMPGPVLTQNEVTACLDALDLADAHPEFVVASGSLPAGVTPDVYAAVARRAKAHGVRLIVDTSGEALRAALREGVWLVKPNLRELREFTGMALGDEAGQIAAARDILARGDAQMVALSLAEKGARLITKSQAWAAHAPPVDMVSAVGAGDSFVGGLTWALSRDLPLPEALRHAVAAGTGALLSHGTGLCHAEAVQTLLPQVSVTEIAL